MQQVIFHIGDGNVQAIAQILKQLLDISDNEQIRKIRIGGPEYVFNGNDGIEAVSIGGVDLHQWMLVNPAPIPVPISTLVTAATTGSSDSTTDADDDFDGTLSESNREIVEGVVHELTNADVSFSAFDVTTKAKEQGATQRHNVLKVAVHEMFEGGDMKMTYDRGQVDLSSYGINGQPFVYHPNTNDINEYDPTAEIELA